MKTSLSFGAGVQTTALLVLIANGEWPRPDSILFADTGNEKPETYGYMADHIAPFIQYHGLEIKVLGSDWRTGHYAAPLYDYCMEHRMLPGTFVRWCTDRYKVKPILRYLKHEMGATKEGPVESWIGISTNEAHRATRARPGGIQLKRYPLIELGLSRADCEDIILEAELPIPPKSGCWFCPFQKQSAWHRMKREKPEQFAAAMSMEKNARGADGKGRYLPMFGSLDRVAAQDEFPGFDAAIEAEGECVTGSCFV